MASQTSPVAGFSADQWQRVDRVFSAIMAASRTADARAAGLAAAGKKRSDFTREEWDRVAESFELPQVCGAGSSSSPPPGA